MTRVHDPFTQALETLRHSAWTGVYRPGRPIVIVDEARRLGLSPTPVREALAWLCGEGLIERAPVAGFLSPRLDAAGLRDRYAFRMHCLCLSLDLGGVWPVGESAEGDLHAWFAALVNSAGNVSLAESVSRVEGRLRSAREAEQRLFQNHMAEAQGLMALPPGPDLRQAMLGYHERRIAGAPQLVADILGPSRPGGVAER